jgi:hypothetical protein
MRIEHLENCAPTNLLHEALRWHEPFLPDGLTVRVVPRVTPRVPEDDGPRIATPQAWYDVFWSIEGPCGRQKGVLPPVGLAGCGLTFEEEFPEAYGETGDHLAWYDIAKIGVIGRPNVRPVEERLAEAPPVSLENLNADQIRMLGGEDAARERFENQRELAVRDARTADIYDWAEMAGRFTAMFDDAVKTPPKLDFTMRAIASAGRVLRARAEVADAEKSLRARCDNLAADPKRAAAVELLRGHLGVSA